MNIIDKAKILSEAGSFDSCGPKMCEVNVGKGLGGIYHAKANHKTCRMFKTLMNNTCSFDCKYCENRTCSAKTKASFKPEELVDVFLNVRKTLDVENLFLSSGIAKDPDIVGEKMLDAVKLLRQKHYFTGYIHFKVLPGMSYDLVKEASQFVDRMSINIEAPNNTVLSELSTNKDYRNDILKRQAWIKRMNLKAGQSTQMIINNLSTDKDVLKMMKWEYDKLDLKRVYYSAFKPVKNTPLENEKEESKHRERRLYNSDYLYREYNFSFKELSSIMNNGMLPSIDPKLAIAKENFNGRIDVNESDYNTLIRVPGIGPTSAKRIVENSGKVRNYVDLKNFGVRLNIAKPFIDVCGKRQMSLGEF